MQLSNLSPELGLQIHRDGEFLNLGFLNDQQGSKLVFLESTEFLEAFDRDPGVTCVVTTPELAKEIASTGGIAQTANPRITFAMVHNYLALETNFYVDPEPTRIDPSASVHNRAVIAETNVLIGPRCSIGANTWIGSGVTLGSGVKIHPGASLGGSGLQVVTLENSTLDLAHAGKLVVEDEVTVMSNAVVSRALFRESTIIGSHSRIGNLAFISHNVQIGAQTIIGHNAVINGNVAIGRASWIGPNATIANNLKVGEEAKVSLGATVVRDIAKGQRVTGVLAVDHNRMLRHLATFSGPSSRDPSRSD